MSNWPHIVEALNSSNVPRPLRVDGSDNLLVTPSGGGGFGYSGQPDESTFTQGTTPIAVVGGEYTTSPAQPASGQAAAAQITQNRALHTNLRKSDGTEIGTLANPARVDPTGTTTQPVSIAATVPISVADGSDTTLGAKADAAVTDSTTTNSLMSFTKGLVKIWNDVWDSVNHWLKVSIQNATLAVTQSGSWSVTANAGTNLNTSTLALESGGNLAAAKADLDTLAGIVSFGIARVSIAGSTIAIKTLPDYALPSMAAWNSSTALNATQSIIAGSGSSGEGAPAALVQLDQTTTITGGVITFEVSYDGGANWSVLTADAVLDPTSTTYAQISLPYTLQASTNKAFLLLVKGGQQVRIKLSTQISGSGTVTPFVTLLSYSPVQPVSIAGTPAVSISGTPTVTANAGTNLNTSALALETGGNLATLAGIVSSAKAAVKSADGDFVTVGAKADTAITDSTTTNTLMSFIKGHTKILNDVWSSASHWLQVSIQNATLAVTQSGSWTVTANAGTGTLGVAQQQTAAALVTGQDKISVTGTAKQLPSNALKNGVILTAYSNNANPLMIGPSTVHNTFDGTGDGYILEAGASTAFAVDNTNRLWINGTAGDIYSWAPS